MIDPKKKKRKKERKKKKKKKEKKRRDNNKSPVPSNSACARNHTLSIVYVCPCDQ